MSIKLCLTQFVIASAISLGAIAPTVAGSVALHSGKYETLMLAVTPDHQVEGFYSETMGEGVTRSCAFYLQGKVDDAGNTPLVTWFDDAYPGILEASPDGVKLTVEEGREHPGCASVLMPEIATGLALSQTAGKPWIGLVTVSVDKAYLQKSAETRSGKHPYIVKGDVVGVLAFKHGWARVEFINEQDRSFAGWIAPDQYTRLSAPEKP